MLVILPIRTESVSQRTPLVNYLLLGANVGVFLFVNALGGEMGRSQPLAFHSGQPHIYQFLTYQFLHADIMHLLGNMLFLWVFGNSVNAKMGDLPYLMFYLAGGVFAAWGFAMLTPQGEQLIGASGAIAAVTTAYLALCPRSRVTVLVWLFIFIHFFEIPAMVLIGLKIIVWDNIIAPGLGGSGAVAHSAHLAGYLFGFVGALAMLLARALPRDQFDILALWKRWQQRREFATAMSKPGAAQRAQFGSVALVESNDPAQQALDDERFEQISGLRSRIAERLDQRETAEAAKIYDELTAVDAGHCLPQRHQLEIARYHYSENDFEQAAAAFERYVDIYPDTIETAEVRLLLGIVYARDLLEYEKADKHLTESMSRLNDEARRGQCLEWLKSVRAALGRPAPDG